MDGFLNVNKMPGMTSFDVIRKLKKIIPKHKLGHLGTLDPMAQGVLPVAVGYATRLIEYVGETDKVYSATMTLGGISDTQDAWGNIQYTDSDSLDLNEEKLLLVLKKYTGTIQQIPPMYSAVHHQGERLYQLARKGITVEREAREIIIEYIKLTGIGRNSDERPEVSIEVRCSKGSYIRTLCHDIGHDLGTGAYLSSLTRIQAGVFKIEQALTLEEMEKYRDAMETILLAPDYPMGYIPEVILEGGEMDKIKHGNQIRVAETIPQGIIRIYGPDDQLAAMARCYQDFNGKLLQPIKVLT